jgi:hypothetical protein
MAEDELEYPGQDHREKIQRSNRERRFGDDRRNAEELNRQILGRRTGSDRCTIERRRNTCITRGTTFDAERQGQNVCPECRRKALAPPPLPGTRR